MTRLFAEGWRRADSFLSIALIGLSGLIIFESNRLPPPFFDPLGSAAVPRFVASLLIVLASFLLARCLLQPGDEKGFETKNSDLTAPWIAIGSVLVPVLYVLAMQLGFLAFAPASSFFVVAEGAVLARGKRTIVVILVPIAILTGYGLNALLTQVFYIDLPQQSFWTGQLSDG